MAQGTVTLHASSRNTTDYSYASISGDTNPIGKSSSNTTYVTVNLKTGSSTETWTYYNIDCSAIPADATISSVTCKAKCNVSTTSTSYINKSKIQLFTGSTKKGEANLSTSTTAFSITAGTWTRQELNNCMIKLYAKRGTSSTSTTRSIYFYGIDFTVVYNYQGQQFMIKLNGNWDTQISNVYQKQNGQWVEIPSGQWADIFSTSGIYERKDD